MDNKLAVCVGLWLAEGNNKCNNEITFTNNCFELIEYFHKVVSNLFAQYKPNIRVYIYDNAISKAEVPIANVIVKRYKDLRANRPYFIWRLASVNLMKEWRKIATEITANEENYTDILKGIFAGEGNIKFNNNHKSRIIRIAQKEEHALITKILRNQGITYSFKKRERAYSISGKWNWDKFAKQDIADLHPEKRKRFWEVYNAIKEEHYPALYLKKSIQNNLCTPQQTKDLAEILNRSPARISEEFAKLKKEGNVFSYKVGSQTYWTGDNNIIIISKIKDNYLEILKIKNLLTSEFAKEFNVCWKSANRRLMELEKLGLVDKYKNGRWYLKEGKKAVVL
ncbi:MAG: hypothetical protein WC713_14240 [Candidatus Methylomirabilota bacterium]